MHQNTKALYIFLGCITIPYILLMCVYIFNTENLSDNHRIIGAIWFTIITAISFIWMIKLYHGSRKINERL